MHADFSPCANYATKLYEALGVSGHVGTGFDQAALKPLYGAMQPLRTDKKPFDQRVKDENATTWPIPKLVGEVKFTEWTSEGEMRHPAFLGLRSDKGAPDVIREQL
jgi:bifunctional non-homologous end joining protein LigD